MRDSPDFLKFEASDEKFANRAFGSPNFVITFWALQSEDLDTEATLFSIQSDESAPDSGTFGSSILSGIKISNSEVLGIANLAGYEMKTDHSANLG